MTSLVKLPTNMRAFAAAMKRAEARVCRRLAASASAGNLTISTIEQMAAKAEAAAAQVEGGGFGMAELRNMLRDLGAQHE